MFLRDFQDCGEFYISEILVFSEIFKVSEMTDILWIFKFSEIIKNSKIFEISGNFTISEICKVSFAGVV